MNVLLDATIKVSLIVVVALVVTSLLRKQSASVRHWVLAAGLGCAALAPGLGNVVPSWSLPLRTAVGYSAAPTTVSAPTSVSASTTVGAYASALESSPANSAPAAGFIVTSKGDEDGNANWLGVVIPIWLAGALLSVSVLATGLGRLAWLASRAQRVSVGPWVSSAANIARAYGIRRPVAILQSTHPAFLVTWGVIRPRIMLPSGAASWPADRIDVVLCHELAHIRRNDWALQIGAELLRAVYWFNPLVWIACRRLRHESERASDDAVLTQGIEGREYAWQLLNLARAFARHGRTWSPAPAIASRSTLEQRIAAMLDRRVSREPITRSTACGAVVAFLALTLPIAAAQTGPATLSGTVFDPGGDPAPNVRLVLDHLQSEVFHELRTDENGRFEFPRVPAGGYRLDVWGTEEAEQLVAEGVRQSGSTSGVIRVAPGLGLTKLGETLTLGAGERLQRNVTLELGPVFVAQTVGSDAGQDISAPVLRNAPESWGCLPGMLAMCGPPSLLDEFEADLQNSGRIPPNVRLPRQLRRPVALYPATMRDVGREGQVQLEGRIGADGFATAIRVVAASHPDFATAAEEGLRQAQWEPARFRGVPVEVPLKLTVDFRVR